MFKKLVIVAVGAMLMFPTVSDAQLFKGRANRRANRNAATTVRAPTNTGTCVYNSQGQCITHTGSANSATVANKTGDTEYDNYLEYLSGGAAVQAPAVPAAPVAATPVPKPVTAKSSLDIANAKVKILNDRLAAAEAAAEQAQIEAEAARAAQIDALTNTIAEVEEAKLASIADFDGRIAKMTEQLVSLQTN